MKKTLTLIVGIMVAMLLAAAPATSAAPVAASDRTSVQSFEEPVAAATLARVGKKCRNNSKKFVVKFVHDIPTGGGAGRAVHGALAAPQAAGGANPDYVMKSWFKWCPKPALDGAKIWKVGQSFNFPNGTNPCQLGFQGMRSDWTWYYTGGASRSLTSNCDSDGYRRHTKKVDVFCEDTVAANPGLENVCSVRGNIKGMWSQISDHEKKWSGGFYFA